MSKLWIIEVITEEEPVLLQVCDSEEAAMKTVQDCMEADAECGQEYLGEDDNDYDDESEGLQYEAEGNVGPYRVREIVLNKFYGWHFETNATPTTVIASSCARLGTDSDDH